MRSLIMIIFFILPSWVVGYVDPERIAKAEVNSWKAYYAKDVIGVYSNLQTMIGLQYQIKESYQLQKVAYQLSIAIAKFGELPTATTDREYETQVLPLLTEGYKSLKDATNSIWNPETVAKYDLEWWIARREFKTSRPDNIANIMSNLYQTLYGNHDDSYFSRAGYLHAIAAQYRDLCKMNWGLIRNTDWDIIQDILKEAYAQLALGIQNNESHQVKLDKKHFD